MTEALKQAEQELATAKAAVERAEQKIKEANEKTWQNGWRPGDGAFYWTISGSGKICDYRWQGNDLDEGSHSQGNCYPTEEIATLAVLFLGWWKKWDESASSLNTWMIIGNRLQFMQEGYCSAAEEIEVAKKMMSAGRIFRWWEPEFIEKIQECL